MNFGMGEDWMVKANKDTKKLFAQCRTKHLIFLMCIPRFDWMQSKYRDDMATCWFRLVRRGLVVQRIPDMGEWDDSWHLKTFQETLGTYNYTTKEEDVKRRLRLLHHKDPCWYDSFHFPALPTKFYKNYLLLRDYYVFKQSETQRTDMHKIMIYNLVLRWKELVELNKKKETPGYKSIANILLNDPTKNKPLIHSQTVSNIMAEMREKFQAFENQKLPTQNKSILVSDSAEVLDNEQIT
jgi:hypothetical protein